MASRPASAPKKPDSVAISRSRSSVFSTWEASVSNLIKMFGFASASACFTDATSAGSGRVERITIVADRPGLGSWRVGKNAIGPNASRT